MSTNASPVDNAEADALEDLGTRIIVLAARVSAATHELLCMIADFDERRGWEPGGYRSCAHWLMQHIGVDAGTAREKVRVARALRGLPEVSAAMQQGGLSFAKARAITRVATRESESVLLEYAQAHTAAELERLGREWRLLERVDEAELERRRHATRCLSVFPDDDGMYLIRGRLDPEVGVLLMRAIEAASDALFSAEAKSKVEPQQRRADAVGLLAQVALAAGFGGPSLADEQSTGVGDAAVDAAGIAENVANGVGVNAVEPADVAENVANGVWVETQAVPADEPACETHPASTATAQRSTVPRQRRASGLRAARYTVMLHVDAATLQSGRKAGRSSFEDGTRVSAETSRRIACDAALVRITKDADGGILDAGRRSRTVPPSLRRALEVRDRGCRFPGCGSRFTDAHHVIHWADGGPTRLGNLVLLCGYHHRLVHEGGFRVIMGQDGTITFFDAHGQPVAAAPPHVRLEGDAVAVLTERQRSRGIEPHGCTGVARYRRVDDAPWELELRATGALEGQSRRT